MIKNTLLSVAAGILFLFSIIAFCVTMGTYNLIESVSIWVRNFFGYFYLYLGLGCVFFLLYIAFSPYGTIKLGKKNQKPEHSLWAWTAMLYSAGMGAGILLRAVQEPVFMQQHPPFGSRLTSEVLALEFTFYQWGFTAWAFYGIFAMVVGYALFVQKKKAVISSCIENSIRNKMARNGIDIMTIVTTVFGLVAAIGLGSTQINGGLNHILNANFGLISVLFLVVLISGLAFWSAWQGVNKGIKIISKLNILMTLVLLLFVFLASDTSFILRMFMKATINYLIDFIPMSIAYGSYNPGMEFLSDWTFYYWAFWLAWAPFTGIFIARISKGRTLRQLLLGVLIIPSLGTFFWFSVFGTSAFQLIEGWGRYSNEFGNVFSSIFIFFENYPMATVLNLITIVLLVSFLVTSLDSGIFVLSMFTDKGKKNPSKIHRLVWAIIVLITTVALLILAAVKPEIDILVAVQKLLIITSLPFAIFIVFLAVIFLNSIQKK